MAKIRVLLVDDHAILREGLRSLLSHYDDVEVIGEAQDGNEALVMVDRKRPDIVLMDIAMPGMGGRETTILIRQQYPQIRVLVLTQYDDYQYIQSMLQAGASGFVTKRTLGVELINAIHVVSNGDTFLQPGVASKVANHIRYPSETDKTEELSEPLTTREQEILKHIVQGKTNPQIAVILCLSVKTVEWHRANLMNKLDVHSVADLVRYALQHGLINENQ